MQYTTNFAQNEKPVECTNHCTAALYEITLETTSLFYTIFTPNEEAPKSRRVSSIHIVLHLTRSHKYLWFVVSCNRFALFYLSSSWPYNTSCMVLLIYSMQEVYTLKYRNYFSSLSIQE